MRTAAPHMPTNHTCNFASIAGSGREQRASLRTWVAVSSGLIGAFMAVLNIQITNASLLNIEGGIGTGVDNGAWISTAYLIGEIIVIPLTDYLSRVFTFRVYLTTNAILFLIFSVACAFAHNLEQMIALRAFQGFTGGVLIPMAFTLVLTRLPKSQQASGLALFALTATFAPAIGPTIGGYLTENYGWQYIFFINLVPGTAMVVGLLATLDRERMQLNLLREGDWFGITAMAIGLAALQTVLEEGNKNDWFESAFIVRLTVVAVVFLTLFVAIELSVNNPAVNLRLLFRRNFGLGTLANILVGFALYGSVYVLPQYLGQVHAYNSEQIGSVMAWIGLPQLLIIPFVPVLMARFEPRVLVAIGLSIFAGSCLMNIHLSSDFAGDQLFWPNIVRAIGQALVLAPLTSIAMVGIARHQSAAASGIFNMLRNLGGAFGTAILATIITKREQYHSNVIGAAVRLSRETVRNRIEQMADYLSAHGTIDPTAAHRQAIIAIGNIVHKQSLIMGFSDTFAVLGILVFAAAAIVMMTKGGASSSATVH
jgi:MFS transporter, DHA2 family, multidrug resistance protein